MCRSRSLCWLGSLELLRLVWEGLQPWLLLVACDGTVAGSGVIFGDRRHLLSVHTVVL